MATDGQGQPLSFGQSDRFCLDGKRLVLAPGEAKPYGQTNTVYHTEVETYATINSVDGSAGAPDYFEVHAKDGTISRYGVPYSGTSEDEARSANNQATGKVFAWAISQSMDAAGNRIDYEYIKDGNGHRISKIDYAYGSSSTPQAYVKFIYEDRPDPVTKFIAGYKFAIKKRLVRIDYYNGGTRIKSYRIQYSSSQDPSEISEIKECTAPSGGVCAKPTTFSWTQPTISVSAGTTFTVPNGYQPILAGSVFADINGDGKADYAYVIADDSGKHLRYDLSNGTSFSIGLFTNGQDSVLYPRNNTMQIRSVDYNADGREDIAVWHHYSAGHWDVYLSSPQTDGSWRLNATPIVLGVTAQHLQFIDMNSDGLVDAFYYDKGNQRFYVRYLEIDASQPVTSSHYYHYGPAHLVTGLKLLTTEGMQMPVLAGDFNGDGIVDLVQKQCTYLCIDNRYYLYELNSALNATEVFVGDGGSPSTQPTHVESVSFADFNKDGLTDILFAGVSNSDTTTYCWINDGATFSSAQIKDMPDLIAAGTFPAHAGVTQADHIADYNGDGYPDLVYSSYDGTHPVIGRRWDPGSMSFASEETLISSTQAPNPDYLGNPQWSVPNLFFDVNGDGTVDFINNTTSDQGQLTITTRLVNANQKPPHKVSQIDNGLGEVSDIDYSALSVTDHYERLSMKPTSQGFVWGGGGYTFSTVDDFYKALNSGFDLNWIEPSIGKDYPVLEYNGPMAVVTQVQTTLPSGSQSGPGQVDGNVKSRIAYYYGEGETQSAGRGWLGFHDVKAVNLLTGVYTVDTYRQDFPFIGFIRLVKKWRPAQTGESHDVLLNSSFTVYLFQGWNAGNPASPYKPVKNVVLESQYDYASGVETAHKETSYNLETGGTSYDEWGNYDRKLVSSYSTGNPKNELRSVETLIDYTPTGLTETYARQHGLESQQTVVYHTPDSAVPDVTRHWSYTYYTTGVNTGRTKEEIAQPGTDNQLTTKYIYDTFGNIVEKDISGYKDNQNTLQTRKSKYVYDTYGRYVDQMIDVLPSGNDLVSRNVLSRNAFGEPLSIQDSDGVTTSTSYDLFGRKYHEYSQTGSWKTIYYRPSTAAVTADHCPSGTSYSIETTVAGGAHSIVCNDALGRVTRTVTTGFDGNWIYKDTEYDANGKILRKSEPFFMGDTEYWTQYSYDLIGRVTKVKHPYSTTDSGTTRFEYGEFYALPFVRTTNPKGQIEIKLYNQLGQLYVQARNSPSNNALGQVTYSYTATGRIRQATTSGPDYATGVSGPVTITTQYDDLGRKIAMSDPDKGDWTYAYNAFGELIEQKNGAGQKTTLSYDSMGRRVQRVDYAADGTTVRDTSSWFYDQFYVLTPFPGKLIYQVTSKVDPGHPNQTVGKTFSYDSFGRSIGSSTNIDNSSTWYTQTQTYDQYGRSFQQFDASGREHGTQNVYNAYGYVEGVMDTAIKGNVRLANYYEGQSGGGDIYYYKIDTMDAHGRVTQSTLGNGSNITHSFSPTTGFITEIKTVTPGSTQPVKQQLEMSYDLVGNLESRTNAITGTVEAFGYDDWNRVTDSTVTTPGSGSTVQSTTYDALGNIKTKSGVGNYSYAQNGAGPHAVTATSTDSFTYQYDADGSLTQYSSNGTVVKQLAYTNFEKPYQIVANGYTTRFRYGSDRKRYQRVDVKASNGDTITTTYIGNVELVKEPDGTTQIKRYIGKHLVITERQAVDGSVDDTATTLSYLLLDHLGSTNTILNKDGSFVMGFSYDPWGRNRNATTWQGYLDTSIFWPLLDIYTTHGFTGHEMLHQVELIHMNGRVYDPRIGRFVSADPNVDSNATVIGFNRYAYADNNPLANIDPTGFEPISGLEEVVVTGHLLKPDYSQQLGWQASMIGGGGGGFVPALVNYDSVASGFGAGGGQIGTPNHTSKDHNSPNANGNGSRKHHAKLGSAEWCRRAPDCSQIIFMPKAGLGKLNGYNRDPLTMRRIYDCFGMCHGIRGLGDAPFLSNDRQAALANGVFSAMGAAGAGAICFGGGGGCRVAGLLSVDSLRQIMFAMVGKDPVISNVEGLGVSHLNAVNIGAALSIYTAVESLMLSYKGGAELLLQRVDLTYLRAASIPTESSIKFGAGIIGLKVMDPVLTLETFKQLNQQLDVPQ